MSVFVIKTLIVINRSVWRRKFEMGLAEHIGFKNERARCEANDAVAASAGIGLLFGTIPAHKAFTGKPDTFPSRGVTLP
jgi:hypothetical protein